jgi:hypothetical protein
MNVDDKMLIILIAKGQHFIVFENDLFQENLWILNYYIIL